MRIQGQDIECLVDTGAAYTALSTSLAALFGLPIDPQHTVPIATAHGTLLTVPMITLPEVRLGGSLMRGVEAIVLTFPPTLHIEGIVGMNVLRHFRVTLESDTATLVLRQRRRTSM
jgi:aspartyl protease family protein